MNPLRILTTGQLQIDSLPHIWETANLTATEILQKAIESAIDNINKKGIVSVCNGLEHYPNDPSNYLINRQVKSGTKLDESDYKKDVFIVKAGSLARKTLLPNSDIDFLVFPSNKESIPYAEALQREVRFELKKILDNENLPLKVDDIMSEFSDTLVPPDQANEKLLQPTRKIEDSEFQSLWEQPSKMPTILRDIEFIHGNKEAFNKLQEISRERLYTPPTCQDVTALRITRELIEEPLNKKLKALTDVATGNSFDPKDDGTRIIEMFTWLVRAKTGIEIKNPISVINEIDSLTSSEKQDLERAFKFLALLTVATRNAEPYVRAGEHPKLNQNNEEKIATQLGMETPLLRTLILQHLTNAEGIISNYLKHNSQ